MVKRISEQLIHAARNGKFIQCKDIHDHTCEYEAIEKFFRVLVRAWKMYLPVHLIPVLIFKWKKLKKTPWKVLKKMFKDTFYSVLWLSTYIALYRYFFCLFKNLRGKIDRTSVGLAGFFCGFGLLWEAQSRQIEMSLYFFPRVLESLWGLLARRNYVTSLPYGEVLVFAVAMTIIMYCYQNEQKSIKRSFLSCFKFLWGET
ncbi:unnamed protein product [Moneuplotes crassus]|uniref:Transmembrane protein 135 N-terminal domain-containing protein n=2 Tax=Euplotes crassus TaxID=5936 RepID=A0AAD2D4V6_EUPCR|nr:unnamed protein product [Moneuplotes crassus]